MNLSEFLNLLLGSTTLTGFYIAWKSRNAQVQITESNALQEMQKAYRSFVEDQLLRVQELKEENRKEVEELKEEILQLRNELNEYKTNCKHCKAA